MVEIPETYLRKNVLKELRGREMYVDTDDGLSEKVYSADVLETISCEFAECSNLMNLTEDDIRQIDDLAEELGQYELIRINMI